MPSLVSLISLYFDLQNINTGIGILFEFGMLPSICRQQFLLMQEQVLYENRIFNIKKKYTLATEQSDNHQFTISKHLKNTEQIMPKFKHSQYFGRYIDNINKHQPILRRGACDAALRNILPQSLTHRQSRIKTEAICPSQKKVSFRSVNNSQTSKKSKEQKKKQQWNQVELKSMHKNLPSLSVRNTCRVDEMLLPIKVEQFLTKGVRRMNQQKNESEIKIAKKVMLRRLQVQLINYNLLGKWVNSSLKS